MIFEKINKNIQYKNNSKKKTTIEKESMRC